MAIDSMLYGAEHVADLEAENARLREMLPSVRRLREIADWIDEAVRMFPNFGFEMQNDLRRWANVVDKALEAKP